MPAFAMTCSGLKRSTSTPRTSRHVSVLRTLLSRTVALSSADSFGLFYDRVPLRALSNALESDGNGTALTANTLASLSLSYGQTNAPVFPNIVSGYTALTLPPTLRLSPQHDGSEHEERPCDPGQPGVRSTDQPDQQSRRLLPAHPRRRHPDRRQPQRADLHLGSRSH